MITKTTNHDKDVLSHDLGVDRFLIEAVLLNEEEVGGYVEVDVARVNLTIRSRRTSTGAGFSPTGLGHCG